MLVIDCDQLVFSCGFATEGEPINNTLQAVKEKLHSIMDSCAHDKSETEIYIKGVGNFREQVVTDYKANRTARKPEAYNEIREYLINKWGAIPVDGMEADDMVSSILWEDYVENEGEPDQCEVICYSPDKDLLNTPGWHMNLKSEEPFWVTEDQAMRHFLYQMLRGDPVDNIKGLATVPAFIKKEMKLKSNRVGEAGAKKIMSDHPDTDDALATIAYLYLLQDDTLLGFWNMAKLLWMGRDIKGGVPLHPSEYLTHDAINDGLKRHLEHDDRTGAEREAADERHQGLQAQAAKKAEGDVPSLQDGDTTRGGDT